MGLKISRVILKIKTKNASFWRRQQGQQAMKLLRSVARRVPAYKSFLNKYRFKASSIRNADDLSSLPTMSKKNYLIEYSLSDMAIDGQLNKPLIFTSTSGSTGEPFYFHRSFDLDWQASVIHELFYLHGQYKKEEPVLVIVCFGMGVWIGGLITYQAFRLLQERGYNTYMITPGINKNEIFSALKTSNYLSRCLVKYKKRRLCVSIYRLLSLLMLMIIISW